MTARGRWYMVHSPEYLDVGGRTTRDCLWLKARNNKRARVLGRRTMRKRWARQPKTIRPSHADRYYSGASFSVICMGEKR